MDNLRALTKKEIELYGYGNTTEFIEDTSTEGDSIGIRFYSLDEVRELNKLTAKAIKEYERIHKR